MIPALKILLTLTTAAAGLIGLLLNLRNRRGRLTFWGKLCVFLVSVSTLTSMLLEIKSDRDNKEFERLTLQSANEAIKRIDRSILKFDRIAVFSVFSLQEENQADSGFAKLIMDAQSELARYDVNIDSRAIQFTKQDGSGFLTISPSSGDYERLRKSICFIGYEVNFYKRNDDKNVTPAQPSVYQSEPGLKISIRNDCWLPKVEPSGQILTGRNIRIDYGFKDGSISYIEHQMRKTVNSDSPEEWIGDGSIASATDLLGAKVVIKIKGDFIPIINNGQSRIKTDLRFLRLNFQNGMTLGFSIETNKRENPSHGREVFVSELPDSLEDLLAYGKVTYVGGNAMEEP